MAWPSCSHASWNIASLSCTQSAYSPPYMASAQQWQRLSWVFYAGWVFGRAGLGRNPALAPHLPGDRAPAHPTLPSRHLSERQAASRRSGRPPAACSGWPPAAHNPKWCTIIRVLNSETQTSLISDPVIHTAPHARPIPTLQQSLESPFLTSYSVKQGPMVVRAHRT